jgi:hypothetical protein
MRTRFNFLPAFLIIGILAVSCDYENESEQQQDIHGQLTGHSECKSSMALRNTEETADSLSCVEYSYDAASNRLTLHHINAGFNCCPGNLSCAVTMRNDTILIAESEEHYLCDCDCLYDLDIEVNGVENRKYLIKFSEPYLGDQEPLIFEADLPASAAGSYCVVRFQYPWGV